MWMTKIMLGFLPPNPKKYLPKLNLERESQATLFLNKILNKRIYFAYKDMAMEAVQQKEMKNDLSTTTEVTFFSWEKKDPQKSRPNLCSMHKSTV